MARTLLSGKYFFYSLGRKRYVRGRVEITDADGKVTFTLTATDLLENDNSIVEYLITAYAMDTNNPDVIPGDNFMKINIVDKDYTDIQDPNNPGTPFPTFILVASIFCVAAVSFGVIRRKK